MGRGDFCPQESLRKLRAVSGAEYASKVRLGRGS